MKKDIKKKERKIKKLKKKQDSLFEEGYDLGIEFTEELKFPLNLKLKKLPQGESKSLDRMTQKELERKRKSKGKSVQTLKKNIKIMKRLVRDKKIELGMFEKREKKKKKKNPKNSDSEFESESDASEQIGFVSIISQKNEDGTRYIDASKTLMLVDENHP